MAITVVEYGNFQRAFDFFNAELFSNKLPSCLITLQRKNRTRGYYSPHRFKNRVDKGKWTDEIALNPAEFEGRSDAEILSTLVHEMVHCYQRLYGSPGRGRYHNREWAGLMIERGLVPSHTGRPDGKQTGDHVSHYIKEGGAFQRACQKLLATGFKLNWQAVENKKTVGTKTSQHDTAAKKDRVKFTCPQCRQNAWAKPSASLICGVCYQDKQMLQTMRDYWDAQFDDWTIEDLAKLGLSN